MKKAKEKRPNRVGVSLSHEYDRKLAKLAIACNMRPTTLAELIIRTMLDNSSYIHHLQDRYNIYPAFKILPVTELGKLKYNIGGTEE